MKQKFFIFLQFIFLLNLSSQGQNLKSKTLKINNFGIFSIPGFLDTLGQSISKRYLIGKNLELMNKSGIKKIELENKINLAQTYFSNYDSTVTLLFPTSTLMNLLSTDDLLKINTDTANLNFDNLNFSFISLQKKPGKNHSSLVKKALLSKSQSDAFLSSMKDFYISLMNTLLPQASIKLISSDYYNYLENYPTVKISLKYSLHETDTSNSYRQDLYCIIRENYQYIFKFEYKTSDESNWKYYEEQFFKKIIFQ